MVLTYTQIIDEARAKGYTDDEINKAITEEVNRFGAEIFLDAYRIGFYDSDGIGIYDDMTALLRYFEDSNEENE